MKNKRPSSRKDRIIWFIIISLALSVFLILNGRDLAYRILLSLNRLEATEMSTVPFRLERGLIVIEPAISGTPLEMILDSAAFDNRISDSSAETLGLPSLFRNDVGDTFGRRDMMEFGFIRNVQLGTGIRASVSAGFLRWGEGALTPCVAPDGIIGGSIMNQASWKIDYRKQLLTIGSPAQFPGSAEERNQFAQLPMSTGNLSLEPRIDILVNSIPVENILLDTGSNGGLTLPISLLEELSIPREQWLVAEDNARSGIFGATEVNEIRAPVTLEMGGLSELTVWASFSDDSEPKIGNIILKEYTVAFVPGAGSLYLLEQPQTGEVRRELDPPLSAGFIPFPDGNSDQWVIIYRERPWDQRNEGDELATGTIITRINGLLPSQVFADNCEAFLGIGEFISASELSLEFPDGSIRTID